MKTTFKTVFTELDDELMNLDIQENAPVDIDIDKIKSEVFMQINGENKTKKKFSIVRIIVDVSFVVVGFVLGGSLGIGTIICAFCVGPVAGHFLPVNEKIVNSVLKKFM